jgi:thiol-disulfide isomerase/thioredoxin
MWVAVATVVSGTDRGHSPVANSDAEGRLHVEFAGEKKSAKSPATAWLWSAHWCAACPAMLRVAGQLKAEGWNVEFVDFDSHDASGCEIVVVPTIQIGRGDVEVARRTGVQSAESLRKWFRSEGVRKTETP